MINLSRTNGLMTWDEQEIELRDSLVRNITAALRAKLLELNPAFQLYRIDAPILNNNWDAEDMIFSAGELVLRPETTWGSYEYALAMLDHKWGLAGRLPFVVWQAGKSYRNEQDKTIKNMRLKEFYQLEYQILYAASTANDYPESLKPFMAHLLSGIAGKAWNDMPSDRLPVYSDETWDIELKTSKGMDTREYLEVCSMSRRHDFPKENVKCFEISIGLDRLVYCITSPTTASQPKEGE